MAFVFTSAGVQQVDHELERLDLLELTMEHAGSRVARAVHDRHPRGQILILAGGGANGGDALVAARHLHALGRTVTTLALNSTHPLTRRMRTRLQSLMPVDALTPEALIRTLETADVALDGLLGTGFRPPLRGTLPDLISLLNASGVPVISLDVPSGLQTDVIESDQPVVHADLTLALAGWKPALLFHDIGEVQLIDLSIPAAILDAHARATSVTSEELRALLPTRVRGAHKGTAGRVHVIGGHAGFTGAPVMTALGALRTGSGLVSVFAPVPLPHAPLEAMVHQVNSWDDLNEQARPDAVALGMGLRANAVRVAHLALHWEVPCVIDADALQPELRGHGHDQVVWTPHPGEAARMLGVPLRDITRSPLDAAETLREQFGGTVVLKGGPTVIATARGLRVCLRGNPGMATGGSGDVLSGVIAALLGQQLDADSAALAGVELHARAGDLAFKNMGYGLTATDIAHEVAVTWRKLTDERSRFL